MFGQKSPEKPVEPNPPENIKTSHPHHSSKERNTRLISNGNNSWSQQQLTPQSATLTSNSFSNRQIGSSSNQNVIIKS